MKTKQPCFWPLSGIQSMDFPRVSSFPSQSGYISGHSTLHNAKYSLGRREYGCIQTPCKCRFSFWLVHLGVILSSSVPSEQGSENCSVNHLPQLIMLTGPLWKNWASCCTLQRCCPVLKISHGHNKIRANQQPPAKASHYGVVRKWLREELRFCFLAVFLLFACS